jgi:serine/threonine-protein kinase
MSPPPLPPRIGKYRIDGILGEGAMGIVYRGHDAEHDRPVAVKTMRKDLLNGENGAELLQRFRREADAGMRLAHRHVVAVYDFGEDADLAFMAMAFIEGRSLKELNAARAPWPLLEALDLANQLLEALDFFHERGVVHRDIKPANIMVDARGTLTVTDFGIARTQSSDLTQVGTVLGTPAYMSPEQITGQPVDGRSDLFAVGVVLYEMLTGTKPFRGEMMTIANNIVTQPHPDPSTLRSGLPSVADRLFRRALAKRREDRFGSGSEFRAALQEMLAAILAAGDNPSPGSTSPPPTPPAARPVAAPSPQAAKSSHPAQRKAWSWGILLLSIVAVIGIAVIARSLLR